MVETPISLSPEGTAYYHAKARCTNPRHKQWKDYGGRGIKFLFKNLEQFLSSTGKRPTAKHRLDRENNNGHYAPGNVRWVTAHISNLNRRHHNKVTIRQVKAIRSLYATGKYTLRELAKDFGLASSSSTSDIVHHKQWSHI